MSRLSTRQLLLTCAAFAFFTNTPAAQAGFEWVPQQKKMNIETNSNADMVVQEAPVTPVANEMLNAPQQQMMVPAPNSGMIVPEENAADMQAETAPIPDPVIQEQPQQQGGIKTMSFNKPQTADVQPPQAQVILPPPVMDNQPVTPAPLNAAQQAKAISVDELEQSETQVDLPAQPVIENMPMEAVNEAAAMEAEVTSSEAPISLVPESRSEQDSLQAAASEANDAEPVVTAPPPNMIEPFPVQAPSLTINNEMPPQRIQAATPPSMTAPSNYEVVQGFGKNMPLALALQQIIPEDHAFSFSKNVDVGQRVEWNGGQSWDVVLRETLWPLNLDAHITDNKVVIYSPAAQLEKTSSAEIPSSPEAELIAVEPAAGQDIATEEAVTLTETNATPISTKRSSIQDPGDIISSSSEAEVSADADMPAETITMSVDTIGDEISAGQSPLWEAKKGDSLKSTLYSWSEKSNMQIIWEASHDFTLEENFAHQGTSKEAFKALLEQESAEGKDIHVRYVDNPQKPGHLAMVIVQDNNQAMMKRQQASDNNQAG